MKTTLTSQQIHKLERLAEKIEEASNLLFDLKTGSPEFLKAYKTGLFTDCLDRASNIVDTYLRTVHNDTKL